MNRIELSERDLKTLEKALNGSQEPLQAAQPSHRLRQWRATPIPAQP